MMKKLLTMVLALAMCGAMAVTAFAADTVIKPDEDGNPNPSTGTTDVSFNVDPTYSITIPDKVELTRATHTDGTVTYENTGKIEAENVRLNEGDTIQVKLESDFTLSAGNTSLPYTVTVGDSTEAVANEAVVAEFTTQTSDQESILHFKANDPEYAGEYTDTVTFTILVSTTATVTPDPDWGGSEGKGDITSVFNPAIYLK